MTWGSNNKVFPCLQSFGKTWAWELIRVIKGIQLNMSCRLINFHKNLGKGDKRVSLKKKQWEGFGEMQAECQSKTYTFIGREQRAY